MIDKLGLKLEVLKPKANIEDSKKTVRLIDAFYDVALDAFGKWLPREAIESRTADASCVIAVYKEERIVAYAVNDLLDINGKKVNYYASGFIRRELQGNGLYNEMNILRYKYTLADIIMTRTQNPVVYREFKKLCCSLGYFLEPRGNEINTETLSLAKGFSSDVEENMVVRGVYWNRSLMNDTPKPQGELETKLWNNLNINNGDAMIIIGIKNGTL